LSCDGCRAELRSELIEDVRSCNHMEFRFRQSADKRSLSFSPRV
jgi:hypothetical protein